MPRIRTIKPDAFTSDSLSQVPRGVRWTFAGLWTYLDDSGRGRDDARLIKAALYPLDDEVSLSILADDLDQLAAVGCICRYEADSKRYLHVPRWEHQKISHPTPSKLPTCSRHDPEPSGDTPEEFVKPPEPLRPERKGKEQGKEGKGTRERATSSDPLFDEFWATYPRKTDKGNARKAWEKAVKKREPQAIIAAAAAYAASKPEPKFTAHPSTWLNGERWDDQPANVHQLPETVPAPRRHVPLEVPGHIDPDDGPAYAAWLREAMQ